MTVVIPRPRPDGEPAPGVGKVSFNHVITTVLLSILCLVLLLYLTILLNRLLFFFSFFRFRFFSSIKKWKALRKRVRG